MMATPSRTLGILTSAALLLGGLAACGGGGGGGGDPGPGPGPAATITARSPDQDATGVALGSTVSITFSKDMDAATLTGSTFRLSDQSAEVAGQVSYANRVATFTPSSPLAAAKTYVVLLTPAVKDAGGNVVGGTSWHFATAHTAAKPAAPTALVANGIRAPKSINLTWDFGSGADGFRIERATDGVTFTQVATVGPEARHHEDGGLEKCRHYTYRVKAFNAAGESPAATPLAPGTDGDRTYDPDLVLADPLMVSGANISLGWSMPGAPPNPWSVIEYFGGSFRSWACAAAAAPYSCAFTNEEKGVHCFWVGSADGCYSKPVCASVTGATMGTLRVTNDSRYDISRIQLDVGANATTDLLAAGYVLPAGQSADFSVAPGSYSYRITSGNASNLFWEDNADVGPLVVTAGSVKAVRYAVPTLPMILTDFSGAEKVWRDYFLNCDSGYTPEWSTITFRPDGSWSSSSNTAAPRAGTVTLVDWPARSSQIKFKLCNDCAVITLNYGLTRSFYYANGPSCTGSPWLFRYSMMP